MGKNVGKNITKNLSSKHSQKPLDHAKESATVALIANGIQKTTEATCDLIGNKIADKITWTAPYNISETVGCET